MPVMLILVMMFVLWLHYETKKASRVDKESTDAFWDKESEANNTRRADISTLPYITIPLDALPMEETNDPAISHFQNEIRNLSQERILNLTGMTNTDIKLTYGAANLNLMSQFDQNFTNLVRTLDTWGQALYEDEQFSDAKKVFEFAITCKSDVKNTYILLSKIYQINGDSEKINQLIEVAGTLSSLNSAVIVHALSSML